MFSVEIDLAVRAGCARFPGALLAEAGACSAEVARRGLREINGSICTLKRPSRDSCPGHRETMKMA